MAKKKKKNKIVKSIERIISPIFFVLFIGMIYVGIFLFSLDFFYKAKFFPRTYIAGIDVSEKSKLEVKDLLEDKVNVYNNGIIFKKDGIEKKYLPKDIGITFNIDKTIKNAYLFGREPMTIQGTIDKLSLIDKYKDFEIVYMVDETLFQNFIDNEFISPDLPVNNNLKYHENDIKFIEGKSGSRLNKKYLMSLINKSIIGLSNQKILVPLENISSEILKSEISLAKIESRHFLDKNITLKFEDKTWELEAETIRNWIDFASKEEKILENHQYLSKDNFDLDKFIVASIGLDVLNGKNYNKILTALLNEVEVKKYLQVIAQEVDIKAQNARFKINETKLELLSPAQKGKGLLIEKNYHNIMDALISNQNELDLISQETGADITKDNIDELGIQEIVAIGESDFSNSPRNRRHNIAVASEKLNGILIKPNEEYSLVENIGEINAATGYLPELVIKENKTIPEYGGGLCQIATTNFRVAINAGLEITERKNHSYAVSYYDPQGTDATIYIPHPDLRFVNDTPGHILIQTKIDGDKLTFEFYGTKDNREVELQGPFYWDRKPDGSFKAKWTQIVRRDDKIIRQQEIKSYYDSPAKYH